MTDQATRVSQAFSLHQQGRYAEARQLYRQALSVDGADRDALHLLGVLELQAGAPEIAAGLLRKAANVDAGDPQIFANLGNACYAAGQLRDAVAAYERSLSLNAASPETLAGLGNTFQSLGEFNQAIERYRQALSLNPALAEVWRGLSTVLLAMEQPTEALAAIERADSELMRSGIAPTPPFVMTRGNVLMSLGRTREAVQSFERVVNAAPTFAPGHVSLGNALRELGDLNTALVHYQHAIGIDDNSTEAHFALALVHKDDGKLDEARNSLRKVLAVDATHGKAHRVLASLSKYSPDDEHLTQLAALAADDDLVREQRKHVCFAFGKALEDCGRDEEAFDAIHQANQLHRESIRYSIERDQRHMALISRVFDASALPANESGSEGAAEGAVPVFVIGMPRSGTSLIEQILASHPRVYGAGELEWIDTCTREVQRLQSSGEGDDGDQLAQLVECGARHARKIARAYRQRVFEVLAKNDSPGVDWFVDKLPANFMNVGLIRMGFPNAVVIHSRRHAVATCWSIYKNYLGARGHGYSFDLEELGRYYRLYQRLMTHWDDVLPGFVRHVDYEQLVTDQENTSKRLLAACGIDWNDACLNFHKTRRPVKTLSATQVRRPMYTDSLEQWKRYERQLKPLIDVLNR